MSLMPPLANKPDACKLPIGALVFLRTVLNLDILYSPTLWLLRHASYRMIHMMHTVVVDPAFLVTSI